MSYFCVNTLLARPVGPQKISIMNQEVFEEYIQCAMDNQSGVLANIINNAIKSAFSTVQQQSYVVPYYQQPRSSANTAVPTCCLWEFPNQVASQYCDVPSLIAMPTQSNLFNTSSTHGTT
jgi:hypothetical protein